MTDSFDTQREKRIRRVTLAGSLVNFVLVGLKFAAGLLGQSAAMIADAVHSLSDFLTDIVILLFVHISSKPVDKDHDYGHGKYETLATALIGGALLAVGIGICWSGLEHIYHYLQGETLERPGMIALGAALVSIAAKEGLYHYTAREGKALNSQAVVANAWHHRSDALSSVGTAIGIGGACLLGENWRLLDPLAAVVVSILIVRVAIQLLIPCLNDLLEKSLPDDVEQEILHIVYSVPDVSQPHNLRTRRIGNRYAIEMHVRMDGDISLHQAHRTATEIEHKLKERYGADTHVGIHVEPLKTNPNETKA